MSHTIEMLEQQLAGQKKAIERQADMQTLNNHPLFRKLILEDFCIHDCARYAQLSADPSLDKNGQADSLALAQAAGHLRRWMQVTHQMGEVAKGQITALEEELSTARAESV